jgi:DNA-binding IclR family transcriptional regulator
MVVDLTRSTALAAAVRDVHGHVIGVISVVGPSERLADAGDVWPWLREAAARLGGPAPGEPRPGSPAVAQG